MINLLTRKKQQSVYLFWILVLAFSLMSLVVATQVLTNDNINRLKQGNRDAAITFSTNNHLQELVNLSFELNTKLSSPASRIKNGQSLRDSIIMLGYNASILEKIVSDDEMIGQLQQLFSSIGRQVVLGNRVLDLFLSANPGSAGPTIDSLRKSHLADSIYSQALSIQKKLEKDLQETLHRNTSASSRLSAYNKILAIIAIAAVLILGTIIINHHLRQVKLIAQLEKATAAAEQSAAVKDQFLANMSHEIRTPLNAIGGFSRLLMQTRLSGEQEQYAGIIDEASSNLLYIVSDILDISKIEAGKLRIEAKYFNLGRVLQTVEYIFSETAAEKQLEYKHQTDSDVPMHLTGDPERLNQILVNLIGNAIKFTKDGFVRVRVSVSDIKVGKAWIHFMVEDSGIGIPEDKLCLVFQRFEQLEASKGDVIKGTGLGLSIVKNLAELMGGSITVTSEYGKGSAFKVMLPFQIAEKISDKKETSEKPAGLPSEDYSGVSVLVVDDNKVNQLLLSQTLRIMGVNPVIVSNGLEAIQAIEDNNFEMVLMDIQMPVMDGYTAIRKIRDEGNDRLPVVAMTAYAMPGEREKCLAAGMSEYMTKPVDFAQLNILLVKYCHTGPAADSGFESNKGNEISFLLKLAGGDKLLARRILEEIRKEIPATMNRLQEIQKSGDHSKVGSICHNLVSTLAPLGTETTVMSKVNLLNEYQQSEKSEDVSVLTGNLLTELGNLEIQLETIMLRLQ